MYYKYKFLFMLSSIIYFVEIVSLGICHFVKNPFVKVIEAYKKIRIKITSSKISMVVWCDTYEPFGQLRYQAISNAHCKFGIFPSKWGSFKKYKYFQRNLSQRKPSKSYRQIQGTTFSFQMCIRRNNKVILKERFLIQQPIPFLSSATGVCFTKYFSDIFCETMSAKYVSHL